MMDAQNQSRRGSAELPEAARPELPEPDSTMEITMLHTPIEIDTYRASTMVEYADEREAWARADERRKALLEVKHAIADEYAKRRHEKVASDYAEGFLDGLDRADLSIRALLPTTKEGHEDQ